MFVTLMRLYDAYAEDVASRVPLREFLSSCIRPGGAISGGVTCLVSYCCPLSARVQERFLSKMLTRVLSALLIASATRYGSLPPGSTSSSLASIPRAIDGDIRVINVTKADDVALRTAAQPIFVGAGTCNTAAADVYVNATTTTNDSVNPFPIPVRHR